MRGEGQRLSKHLTAAFAEIDRLREIYRDAIDKLETNTLANLSPQSAAKWFEMVRPVARNKGSRDSGLTDWVLHGCSISVSWI